MKRSQVHTSFFVLIAFLVMFLSKGIPNAQASTPYKLIHQSAEQASSPIPYSALILKSGTRIEKKKLKNFRCTGMVELKTWDRGTKDENLKVSYETIDRDQKGLDEDDAQGRLEDKLKAEYAKKVPENRAYEAQGRNFKCVKK